MAELRQKVTSIVCNSDDSHGLKHAVAFALGLALAFSCSKKTPEIERKPKSEQKEPPAAVQRPESVRTRAAAPPAEPVRIDPSKVPVEEDYRRVTEQSLTKKSDLRAELDRIERSIASPGD